MKMYQIEDTIVDRQGERSYFFRNIILKDGHLPIQHKSGKNGCPVDGKERESEHYSLKPQKGCQIRLSLGYVLLFRSMNVECLAWWIGKLSTTYLVY